MGDKISIDSSLKSADDLINAQDTIAVQTASVHSLGAVIDTKDKTSLVDPVDKLADVWIKAKELDGKFSHDGVVWVISLDNAQTHALEGLLAAGGGALAAASGPLWPAIALEIGKSVTYIELVNWLGGENGVDINGVVGARGIIVTPRLGGLFDQLVQAGRIEASGMAVVEYLVYASTRIPALGSALNLPVVATVLNLVRSGTPIGWAITEALGFAVNLLTPAPDVNAHGAVLADRTEAREWESFYLGTIGDGDRVALLSWQGFFSAQMGGGHGVYANRPQVGDWEKWRLINNGDGTVSLQTFDGHYLCAEMGGGRECQANRTAIGNWEKFYLVNLSGGKIALKTHDKGLFVSVQQNL